MRSSRYVGCDGVKTSNCGGARACKVDAVSCEVAEGTAEAGEVIVTAAKEVAGEVIARAAETGESLSSEAWLSSLCLNLRRTFANANTNPHA